MSNRLVHFEIPADDPERAVKFYKDTLDWDIFKLDGPVEYYLITTGPEGEPGINGAIYRREEGAATRNTVDVDDLDAAVKSIEDAGGKVVQPKQPVPGVGWMAYVTDTEGNVFGLMQADEQAA